MDESLSLAHELLESLISEVVTVSQWDAATIARTRSQEGGKVERHRLGDGLLDVCDLVRWRCPERQLVSYSLRNSARAELLQLKCVQQQFSGYCGHYALYLALCMLEACRSSQEERVMGYLAETISVEAYWRRYWLSVSQLMVKASVDDWWPWTEEYIYTGDMERSFLRYLLSTDPHIQSLQGEDKIVVMQYCYGTFQDDFSTICEIQEKINRFHLTSSPAHLVFILGVTNHWVTLVAYKNASTRQYLSENESFLQEKDTPDRIGLVYLDSNNVPVLSYNDADIVRHIEESEKKEIEKKGSGFTQWHRAMYQQALVDQREVVLKLARAVSGAIDLRSELIQDYVDRMLESFGSCIVKKMNGDTAMYLPLLMDWLENCHSPDSLRKNLGPMLALATQVHHSGRLSHLCSWVRDNQAWLCGIEESGIESVDRFTAMLVNINGLLESHLE